MAEVGKVVEVRHGDPLMQAGQQFRYMIFVLEGNVKIFREDEEGAEFFMYSLTSGSTCALSLACSNRMEESVVKGVTLDDGILLLVPHEYMDRWRDSSIKCVSVKK